MATDAQRAKRRDRKRANYRAHIPKVSAEVLGEAGQDPQFESRHGIKTYVICRICGAKCKKLENHLIALHPHLAEKYPTDWPGAPLVCPKTRKFHSAITKNQMKTSRGRARPELSSVSGHPGETPLRWWSVVCLIVEGCSHQKIAEDKRIVVPDQKTERWFTAITRIARQLGFSGKRCLYYFGDPITRAKVAEWQRASGLSHKDFANFTAISWQRVRGFSETSGKDLRIIPGDSRKIRDWLDRVIRTLMMKPDTAKGLRHRDYNRSAVLKSFFPDLGKKYDLLFVVLSESQKFVTDKPEAGIEQWQDWLCDQAGREVAGGLRGNLFTRFLPWAPDVSRFIEGQNKLLEQKPGSLDVLRINRNLWQLAEQFFASYFDTTRPIVRNAWQARRIEARDMQVSIFRVAQLTPPAQLNPQATLAEKSEDEPSKKPRKHGPDPNPEENIWFKIGLEIEKLIAKGESLIDARKKVQGAYQYQTIVRYHMLYKEHLRTA